MGYGRGAQDIEVEGSQLFVEYCHFVGWNGVGFRLASNLIVDKSKSMNMKVESIRRALGLADCNQVFTVELT